MRQKLILVLLALFWGASVAGASQTTDLSPETKALINANYGKIPLSFEANAGQINKKVKFLSRGQGWIIPDAHRSGYDFKFQQTGNRRWETGKN